MIFQLELILTGHPKVLLHLLRIRVNVDHAGLSQQLELFKDFQKLLIAIYKASQNNNSLTVQAAMETRHVMEV